MSRNRDLSESWKCSFELQGFDSLLRPEITKTSRKGQKRAYSSPRRQLAVRLLLGDDSLWHKNAEDRNDVPEE